MTETASEDSNISFCIKMWLACNERARRRMHFVTGVDARHCGRDENREVFGV